MDSSFKYSRSDCWVTESPGASLNEMRSVDRETISKGMCVIIDDQISEAGAHFSYQCEQRSWHLEERLVFLPPFFSIWFVPFVCGISKDHSKPYILIGCFSLRVPFLICGWRIEVKNSYTNGRRRDRWMIIAMALVQNKNVRWKWWKMMTLSWAWWTTISWVEKKRTQ